MADVGGQRVDLPLLGVERERVVPPALDPEVAIEAAPELSRVALQPARRLLVVPHLAQQASRSEPRVVGVALQLTGADRGLGLPAVREENRVVRVLPAVVVDRTLRIRSLVVLDVAVTVAVCGPFEPAERRARLPRQPPDGARLP